MENSIKPVRIDPEFARTLLDMNTRNRPKNWSIIKSYADDMMNSRWKLNGETIKVTSDGVILDGQHRLEACLMSGVPFDTYFVEVEDAGSFDTIDIGRKRTGSDVFSIRGEKNTALLASTIGLLCEYAVFGSLTSRSYKKTHGMLENFLEANPRVRDSVFFAQSNSKACDALMTRTVAAFCHFIFHGISEKDATTFMAQVMNGENLQRTDPAWVLRHRLMVERAQKHKGIARNSYLAALVIKAWNVYRAGKACGVLKYMEVEDFPVPK